MNELDKLLPTPPQLGPPLPGILKAHWPWVKNPPPAPSVRAVAETAPAPELSPAPALTPSAAATFHRATEYVECPPELLHKLSPVRIDPSWLQAKK